MMCRFVKSLNSMQQCFPCILILRYVKLTEVCWGGQELGVSPAKMGSVNNSYSNLIRRFGNKFLKIKVEKVCCV